MIGVLSVLLVLAISLLVTRFAAVALVHTGLSREAARFQARSAFTGVGFTTEEAEGEVNHPVRRRIVAWLMLVGNVGIITVMSSLILSFIQIEDASSRAVPVVVLVSGLAALWLAGTSRWVDQRVCRLISWALNRWTSIDARDYAGLLHVREDYGVCELRVSEGDWAAGRRFGDLGLSGEGLLVLGIECAGNHFIGAPGPYVEVRAGDRLILYGRTPRIAELDRLVAERGGFLRKASTAISWFTRRQREQHHAMLRDLCAVPLLRKLPAAEVDLLVHDVRRRILSDEQVLFREGEPSEALYFVRDGQLELLRDGARLGSAGPRSVLGELGLVAGIPRTLAAMARGAVEVFEIRRDDFERWRARCPEFDAGLRQLATERLAEVLEQGGRRSEQERRWGEAAIAALREGAVLPSPGDLRRASEEHGGGELGAYGGEGVS